MRVPVSWLADYVSIEMPLEELTSRLSVSSAEIEEFVASHPYWIGPWAAYAGDGAVADQL